MLVLGLLAVITLGVIGTVAVVVVILRDSGSSTEPEPGSHASAPRAPTSPAAGDPSPDPAAILPAIPPFPSPAHRLAPGVYMFGQLFRWDGRRWSAEIGDDCEPGGAGFDPPLLGTCAVTWDSVHRRTSPGGPWAREYRSPNGRPRLSGGWGHPVHGLFVVGGSSTLLHSRGDGRWTRETVPDALLRNVISAVWGDDTRLYVGMADGRIAWRSWVSPEEWTIEQTPTTDFIFVGVSTPRGLFAVAQSGEVLHRADPSLTPSAPWTIEKKLGRAVKGLLADSAGRVWVASAEGIFRSDAAGQWVSESVSAAGTMNALASNGRTSWTGGARSILARRETRGDWTASPPGRGGTISALWVGPDQELLVGTEFMIEVAAGGTGKEADVIASVTSAS